MNTKAWVFWLCLTFAPYIQLTTKLWQFTSSNKCFVISFPLHKFKPLPPLTIWACLLVSWLYHQPKSIIIDLKHVSVHVHTLTQNVPNLLGQTPKYLFFLSLSQWAFLSLLPITAPDISYPTANWISISNSFWTNVNMKSQPGTNINNLSNFASAVFSSIFQPKATKDVHGSQSNWVYYTWAHRNTHN
jgi:hypothetical protein